MSRWVAFLRGINVGGHIVKKEKLKEIFDSMEYHNVSTYRQSGNVIFETQNSNTQELKSKIENTLKVTLGFDVAVFIRTIPQLECLIKFNPFKHQTAENSSFLITFLPSSMSSFPLQLPITIPKSTAQILSAEGAEVFSITHGGGEGALPNPFLETKLKVKATTRNMNIIEGIVEKFTK